MLSHLQGLDSFQKRSHQQKATRLIENNPKALLTDVILVETVWTLKNKKYNLDKPALLAVIEALIQEFCFEDNLTVWTAFNDYRDSNAGFADALIANKAKLIAKQKATQLRGVYTFDIAAQPLEGMLAISINQCEIIRIGQHIPSREGIYRAYSYKLQINELCCQKILLPRNF